MYPTQQPEQPAMQPVSPKTGKGKKLALMIAAIVAVVAVAGGVIWWYFQSQAEAALEQDTPSVEITAAGYTPNTITVKSGQDVTWTNADTTARDLVADGESLPDFGGGEALNAGDTYTYTFDQAGTYHYYDPTDPTKYTGTVVVE